MWQECWRAGQRGRAWSLQASSPLLRSCCFSLAFVIVPPSLWGKGLSKDPVPTPKMLAARSSPLAAFFQDRPQEPPSSTVVLVLTAQPRPACLAGSGRAGLWLCPLCRSRLAGASVSSGQRRVGARPGKCCQASAPPPQSALPGPPLPCPASRRRPVGKAARKLLEPSGRPHALVALKPSWAHSWLCWEGVSPARTGRQFSPYLPLLP